MDKEQLLKDYQLAIEIGDTELEDAIAAKLDALNEKGTATRFLSGMGGELLKSAGGIAGLVPGADEAEKYLVEKGQEGIDTASGFAGGAGKFAGAVAPYLALPGGGILSSAAQQAALSAATTPGGVQDRAIAGGVTGLLSAGVGVLPKAASKAYDIVSRPFAKEKNAVRQIVKELGDQVRLPQWAPSFLREMGPDQMGPGAPKFFHAGDIKPTTGMLTDDANLLRLEMNARNRSPADFFARDAENTAKAYKTMEGDAIGDVQANMLQDALNARTGSILDEAFNLAKTNPSFRDQFGKFIDDLSQRPGVRESKSMPMVSRSQRSLIRDPSGKSNAMPEDLYALRKEIDDSLTLKTLVPDELQNSAKNNRRLAVEIKQQLDDAMNTSSGGKFGEYLEEYAKGMIPITQGRSVQNILDKFENSKRILGTDIPQMTPAALRKAVDDNTYINLGKKGWKSTVDDTTRQKIDDIVDVMNKIEQAKGGVVSITGSPTASYLTSLARDGLTHIPGAPFLSKGLATLNALGVTSGKRALDEAMLDPAKLQKILDTYNRQGASSAEREMIVDQVRRIIQQGAAGAVNTR